MQVSIVTLNYKKKDLTTACITSLWEQYKSELLRGVMEVIIVDNDSHDGSVEELRRVIKEKKFENMHVVANSQNAGFGAGNNLGVKKAKGDLILFLNNDTLSKDGGIMRMVEYLKDHP